MLEKQLGLLSLFVHTLEHVIRIYTNLTRKESEFCGEQIHHNTRPSLPAISEWHHYGFQKLEMESVSGIWK